MVGDYGDRVRSITVLRLLTPLGLHVSFLTPFLRTIATSIDARYTQTQQLPNIQCEPDSIIYQQEFLCAAFEFVFDCVFIFSLVTSLYVIAMG